MLSTLTKFKHSISVPVSLPTSAIEQALQFLKLYNFSADQQLTIEAAISEVALQHMSPSLSNPIHSTINSIWRFTMGKRGWLNSLIDDEYIPALSQLQDSPDGVAKAQQLALSIRDGWAARGAKELKQQQSLMDQTRRAIKDKLGENHFSLNYVNFTTAEYTQLNDEKQGKVAQRNTQCVILDPGNVNALITRSVNLLHSPEWADVAAALAVLTGRRSTEVMATAEFTPKTQYSVIFTGALKRRGEEQTLSFEIPTLCQAEYVLKGLRRL
jgi:hypothetical protein